jgi:single-stranded DNA-binding protein
MKNLNNQVQLIGRVGNDIELKETKTGKKFINI